MIAIIICFVLMLVLHIATPYWFWIMVIPFMYEFFLGRSGWHGFIIGAASSGLLWLITSLFYFFTSADLIVPRIASMMAVNMSWLIVGIATLIAIVAGGAAGSCGFFLRNITHPPKFE